MLASLARSSSLALSRSARASGRASASALFSSSASRRADAAAAGGEEATKVTLNFAMPTQSFFDAEEVSLVQIPGVTGEYGVTAGHTPVIAELKPGVVSVYADADDAAPERYFVSGGFAFTHANSVTDITAVEAVKVEELDEDAAKAGLAAFKSKMDAATPETREHAEAQVGFECHEAMCEALGLSTA